MIRTRTRSAFPLVLALAALAATLTSCVSPGPVAPKVTPETPSDTLALVWKDEFTGTAGTQPSAARWTYDVGTDWGNAQLEYDTARPANVAVNGQGQLAITARVESFGGRGYTSGRITTRGLYSRNRGRFEARIKLPPGRGLWPAFWLLGDDISTSGWPGCGEIDVMEYRGQQTSIVHGSLHGPGYSGGSALTKSYTLTGSSFDADYHVFAIEWTTNKIVWSVDGNAYQTITPASLPPGSSWVFDHPFHIILDLAVGGNYVGAPDAGTVFPATMLVDYVRVYSVAS